MGAPREVIAKTATFTITNVAAGGINTREKRQAVTGVGRPYLRGRQAVGATDEESRINTGNAYGGNALSPAAAGGTCLLYTSPSPRDRS